jgi:hypothetical protein
MGTFVERLFSQASIDDFVILYSALVRIKERIGRFSISAHSYGCVVIKTPYDEDIFFLPITSSTGRLNGENKGTSAQL